MIEEAHLDELLQIVGDVGAEVVAARAQLASGELLVADVVEQQRLHRIEIGTPPPIELVLNDVQQTPVKPLDQRQSIEIERPDMVEARLTLSGLDRLGNGLHELTPSRVFSLWTKPCIPRP